MVRGKKNEMCTLVLTETAGKLRAICFTYLVLTLSELIPSFENYKQEIENGSELSSSFENDMNGFFLSSKHAYYLSSFT